MRATATWTNTETDHFEAAEVVRDEYLLTDVLQNIEHLGQNHAHDRNTANDGGVLVLNELEEILLRMRGA